MGLWIIGIAITNAIGLTSIPLMVITPNFHLTGIAQWASASAASILLIAVSVGIFKLVQKYCKYLFIMYRKTRLG